LDISERYPRSRDYTRHELHEALHELIACFLVYRTYVQAEAGLLSEIDETYINAAVAAAKEGRPDLDAELFDFVRDILVLRLTGARESELVMRFQQLSGPVMAKGAEDTAFYTYNRLIALNEVGGDPGRFGASAEAFHEYCAETAARGRCGLLATSTHDTKRSEDVRARICLLSEIPERWGEAVRRWSSRNEMYRTDEFPDRNLEYLLYQTLVGAWPIEKDRVLTFAEKAAREAKVHTSWNDPNNVYENALRTFIEGLFADSGFLADLKAFVNPLVQPGRTNSLAQTLLKLTAPGVPDLYQGTEIWDLSLVDPDNRRPVDYGVRRRLLRDLDCATPEEILSWSDRGLPKLWTIRQALELRRRRTDAFGAGASYQPLYARGAKEANVVAFLRGSACATIVPRLVLGLDGGWGDTAIQLPPGRWRNRLTGDLGDGVVLPLADLLARFPVALLEREEEDW
jgi:(1->4)-alpha-D-glucan 1-alpha-D-glucosylmutase